MFGLSFLNSEEVSEYFIKDFMTQSYDDPKILRFQTKNYIDEFS